MSFSSDGKHIVVMGSGPEYNLVLLNWEKGKVAARFNNVGVVRPPPLHNRPCMFPVPTPKIAPVCTRKIRVCVGKGIRFPDVTTPPQLHRLRFAVNTVVGLSPSWLRYYTVVFCVLCP